MLIFTKKNIIKQIIEKGIGVSLDWWKWIKDNPERKAKKSPKKLALK